MTDLFAPVCSIATTKRRRFFWAAWWSGPPVRRPFRKPDASDGGAATREEALAAAEARAGQRLAPVDSEWARAWMRILRGQDAWPSRAPRRSPLTTADRPGPKSIWELLGVARDVTDEELKAAYRRRVLETHPDHGGDPDAFQAVVRAFEEAGLRRRHPRRTKR